jgi:AraC-like DNA-binding protein
MKPLYIVRTTKNRPVFLKYALTNMAIMLLPIILAAVFYAVTSDTIRKSVDDVARAHLTSGARAVDTRLQDIQRAAAQLSIDYDINFYLNKEGPLSSIEEYDLRKISEKLNSFKLGNELLSLLMIYFYGTNFIAYDSGSCIYDSFYGPVFSVQGLDSVQWKNYVLGAGSGSRIIAGLKIKYSDRVFDSALSMHPVGVGAFRRGVIVGMIEESDILYLLEGLQRTYGGIIAVYDKSGSVVATSDVAKEQQLRSLYYDYILTNKSDSTKASTGIRLEAQGLSYRLYKANSSVADWIYVAALDETHVLKGPRRVMYIAIIILVVCFIVGTYVSYFFALTNSKPVDRIINMILGESTQTISGGSTSVFQRVEEAIAGLADKNRKLEGEVLSVSLLARMNFLQLLLAGNFKDRFRFEEEMKKVGVVLSGPHFVMIAGIDTVGVSVSEAGEDFSRAVMTVSSRLRNSEYNLLYSPGEAAFILAVKENESPVERAEKLTEELRASCSPDFRGTLSFGAGTVVDDPFLLVMSYAQAESARSRAARTGSLDLVAFGRNTKTNSGDRYPIDLEESIMRAVRSANLDLLKTLLDSLYVGNEEVVNHTDIDADLAAALRGTLLRLCAEFPKETSNMAVRIDATRSLNPKDAIKGIALLLVELANLRESAKKSHNKVLAESIRKFIVEHFGDPNLGLAMVADVFRMSENYLSNLYKEQAGECISETIENVRISEAKERLKREGESLEKIAQVCGYRSVASFRRAFKRVVGQSPSDYRDSLISV